ncbi:hypothetical protein PMG11_11036 [Penicillium brasilianum]|uniref:Uncharacterized protein n=1 Tax=Penicillium brasilianum TaxID=104259 RepID=A0A0F7U0V2_PENBI|nr:hypothetical protein PMG11_11036 [Penicillium brasilianum]
MEIDSDITRLERGEPNKVDDNIPQETGESEATNTTEQKSENPGNGTPEMNQQSKDTGTLATENSTKETNLHSADNDVNDVNQLFVSQTLPLDSKQSSSKETAQEHVSDNKRSSDGEIGRRPKDFADFIIDLTQDDDSPSFSLEEGTVLLRARGGKLSLNSKFYEKACTQVKNFRDWAGKNLDIDWDGEAREGRDDRSPTPLEETPEPEDIARNTARKNNPAPAASNPAASNQAASNQAASNQAASNQASSNQAASNQAASNQAASNQAASNQAASNQAPSNQAASNQAASNQAASNQTDSNRAAVNLNSLNRGNPSLSQDNQATALGGEDEEDPELISTFYEALLDKKGVDSTIPWKELPDALFAEFQAAAKIYIRHLKKQNISVADDMGIGKGFKKGTFYTPVALAA